MPHSLIVVKNTLITIDSHQTEIIHAEESVVCRAQLIANRRPFDFIEFPDVVQKQLFDSIPDVVKGQRRTRE